MAWILDYLFAHTLNNLIASYCNDSIDRVVNGVLIASLECNKVGCFHNTQSERNYVLLMMTFVAEKVNKNESTWISRCFHQFLYELFKL